MIKLLNKIINRKNINRLDFTEPKDLYCVDLLTQPLKPNSKIFIVGALSYIGVRLVYELLARGYRVRIIVRSEAYRYKEIWPEAEIIVADELNYQKINFALKGIDTLFYMTDIHNPDLKSLRKSEINAARNYRMAADENTINRIIYLSGLFDNRNATSDSLRNGAQVSEELLKGSTPVTILKAALIIGSGSNFFYMIQKLVRNLPVTIIPRGVNNKCQPIGIRDVIKYLVGSLETSETIGKSFDIGGSTILSFKDILYELERITSKKKIIITLPFFSIKIYNYIISSITRIPLSYLKQLMEVLRNEVICKDNSIEKVIPLVPLTYMEAIKRAISQEDHESLFCIDLPTFPSRKIEKILVTGASGYIGGRLVNELLKRGYKVKIMVRSQASYYKEIWPEAEIVTADASNYKDLKNALKDVDTAYYLIHSLLLGPKKFHKADIKLAKNFRIAAKINNIKRIIYLGGLGDVTSDLSDHLQSRVQVAEELKKGSIPVTILRAAIIIGSGSASYEIIHHIIKKIPVIPVAIWAKNRCQPIGIRDTIKYLVGCLETPETRGKSFDIGGSTILTYQEMMEQFAKILNKKKYFIYTPISNIGVYSYFISLLTPVPAPLVKCLLEGIKNEVICKDNSIRNLIPFEPLTYREATQRAISREEQDRVYTRWSDAYPKNYIFATKLHELPRQPQYKTAYSIISDKPEENIFRSICSIGGKEGWFYNNWMWRLRGMLDKMLLGVGTARGRKSPSTLVINDVLDFWRVEDLKKNRHLLLRAEMKLPGRAWLEFRIQKEDFKNRLTVTAYYFTETLFGKIYWYIFLPFHHLIFNNLIVQIEKRS